jgi:hypothetical protein
VTEDGQPCANGALANGDWMVAQQTANGVFLNSAFLPRRNANTHGIAHASAPSTHHPREQLTVADKPHPARDPDSRGRQLRPWRIPARPK